MEWPGTMVVTKVIYAERDTNLVTDHIMLDHSYDMDSGLAKGRDGACLV